MAYTQAQLVAAYTAANDGVAPDSATTTLLGAFATQTQTGQLADSAALAYVINSADKSTAVANLAYNFFSGKTPTKAGLDFLVNSTGNATDLNDPYYTAFNIENRYMNFAANLGIVSTDYATTFNTTYGTTAIPLFSTFIGVIYEQIIGSSYAAAAGINVTAALNDVIGRQAAFTQIARERGIITSTSTQAQIDIATRAVAVGYLLVEGIKADVGVYAAGSNNLVNAMINGNAQYNVNLQTTYSILGGGIGSPVSSGSPIVGGTPGTTYTMIAGVDAIPGTNNDDIINGQVIPANGTTALFSTFGAIDTVVGGPGNDTINILVTDGSGSALAAQTLPAAAVSGVENVNVRVIDGTAAASVTVVATNFTGATAFTNDRSIAANGAPFALVVNSVGTGQAVGINGLGGATVVGGITADYSNTSTATTNFTAIVNLSGGTGSGGTTGPAVTLTTAGGTAASSIGTATINSNGTVANVVGAVALDAGASAVRALNIKADANLTTGAITGLGGVSIGTTAATTTETIAITGNGSVTTGLIDGAVGGVITTLNITTGPGTFTTTGIGFGADTVVGGADTTLFGAGATINVSGGATTTAANAASVTLGALVSSVTTLNASGLTAGGVSATIGAAPTLVFTGGAATDVVTIGAGQGAAITGSINAGAGTDIIAFTTGADLAANLTSLATGFETLRVSNGIAGSAQTFDPTLITGITAYQVGAAANNGTTAGTITLNNLVANASVTFIASQGATTSTRLNLANASGAADVVNVRLDNLSTATAGGGAVSINSILLGSNNAAGQIETLNITSAGRLLATGGYNLVTLGASGTSATPYTDANVVNLLGSVSQTLVTGDAQHPVKVDASAATASVFINNNATATGLSTFTILGSARNDTVGTTNTATILGGGGGDYIALGANVQTVVYTKASDSQLDLAGTNTSGVGGTAAANTGTVGASLIAGTANASAMDIVSAFASGADKIDLRAFGFTGTKAGLNNVTGVATSDADLTAKLAPAGTGVNGLFGDGIFQYGTALVQGGAGLSSGAGDFLVVDVNGDGVYTAGSDLIVKLTGTTGGTTHIVTSDILFN